jgi:hypothetical protein
MILASAAGPERANQPIYLAAEAVEGGMRIRVVGNVSAPYQANFTIEVLSGGNHSRHQGTTRLQPGDSVTLSTVSLGAPAGTKWTARLQVEPLGQASYEQVLASE